MKTRTVWKYEMPFPGPDRFCIRMPMGAEPITVQVQHGEPQIWALVDPTTAVTGEIWFRIAGTGHPIEDEMKRYVGTFQVASGSLVFHLFEIVRPVGEVQP